MNQNTNPSLFVTHSVFAADVSCVKCPFFQFAHPFYSRLLLHSAHKGTLLCSETEKGNCFHVRGLEACAHSNVSLLLFIPDTREHLGFSEWRTVEAAEEPTLITESCTEVTNRRRPEGEKLAARQQKSHGLRAKYGPPPMTTCLYYTVYLTMLFAFFVQW